MLPRKFIPDQDLILCASLNKTIMTTNIHPLYLPPVVCWVNRTSVQVLRVKGVIFNALKVMSTFLIGTTLLVHIIRLWNMFAWGLLGTLWSLLVCITLISGSGLTILSSERRSCLSSTSVMVNTMTGISLSQKVTMFTLFLATYIHTWAYYQLCSRNKVVWWVECSAKRGPSLLPILKCTTFVFVWINAIGFIRLLRPN